VTPKQYPCSPSFNSSFEWSFLTVAGLHGPAIQPLHHLVHEKTQVILAQHLPTLGGNSQACSGYTLEIYS
jgi:hypothetical protein